MSIIIKNLVVLPWDLWDSISHEPLHGKASGLVHFSGKYSYMYMYKLRHFFANIQSCAPFKPMHIITHNHWYKHNLNFLGFVLISLTSTTVQHSHEIINIDDTGWVIVNINIKLGNTFHTKLLPTTQSASLVICAKVTCFAYV